MGEIHRTFTYLLVKDIQQYDFMYVGKNGQVIEFDSNKYKDLRSAVMFTRVKYLNQSLDKTTPYKLVKTYRETEELYRACHRDFSPASILGATGANHIWLWWMLQELLTKPV